MTGLRFEALPDCVHQEPVVADSFQLLAHDEVIARVTAPDDDGVHRARLDRSAWRSGTLRLIHASDGRELFEATSTRGVDVAVTMFFSDPPDWNATRLG